MQVHEYTIQVTKRSDPVTIWFIGDTHVGASGCALDKLKGTVDLVSSTPDSYWLGMGDYCDFVGFRDPRFDPSQIDQNYRISDLKRLAEKQIHHFCKIMAPIRDKCIGYIEGNHDEKWERHYHWSPVRYLEQWSGGNSRALSCSAIITIRVRDDVARKGACRYAFDIYAFHGYGGARKMGAEINKVIDLMGSYEADIYAMGHAHHLGAQATDRIGKRKSKLALYEKRKAFFLTGSYLKTADIGDSNYAERKGYPPRRLGSPRVIARTISSGTNEDIHLEAMA